jgi:hypothetical protein
MEVPAAGPGALTELVHPELGQQSGSELGKRWIRPQPRTVDLDGQIEGESPVGQDEDPVGQKDGLVDVVCDEEDRRVMPFVQPDHQFVHPDPGEGVERPERFVQEQEVRLTHEGAGD